MNNINLTHVSNQQRILLSAATANKSITSFTSQLSKQENVRFVFAIEALDTIAEINKYSFIEHFINIKKGYWAQFEDELDTFPPLDEELLRKMSCCESTFLKMCDRLSPQNHVSYLDRKRMYLKQLRYWNHILKSNEINLFIATNIPHEMSDYVIYSLCKMHGIKTIIFDDINLLPDCVFLVNDIEKSCESLKFQYEELLNAEEIKLERFNEIFIDFKDKENRQVIPSMVKLFSIENQRALLSSKIYYNFSRIRRILKFKKLLQLINLDFWIKFFKYLDIKIKEKEAFNCYELNACFPDLSKKYIYWAIHYQPECSTSPMGGYFVDQLMIPQLISFYLPEDVFIYAKEHPLQMQNRTPDFYRDLLKIPNIKLMPRDFPTLQLIDNSIAVATVTGSAGWEGFLSGKPVLKFGNSFYQYAPGVFLVKSVDDLKRALDTILNNFRPDFMNIKRFLRACELSSVKAWTLEEHKEPLSKNSILLNSTNLCEAVIQNINS